MRGRALIEAAERSGARLLLATSCLTLRGTEAVLVAEGEQARTVAAGTILLAPGAHDRPVAFPGWTLPGVLTAGAAQTIVKAHRVTPGERLLFAGSGPLALAFPAQLHHYGVNVVAALEAGPAPGPGDVARLAAAARGNVRCCATRSRYRSELLRGRVPLRYRRIVVRAEGRDRVEAVVHAAVDARLAGACRAREERVEVDALCIGYGFFPSVELFRVAGCDLRYDEDLGGPVVVVDAWQRTTVPGVLAAGDGTGVARLVRRRGPGPARAVLGLAARDEAAARRRCGGALGAAAPLPARARPDAPRRARASTS